MLRTKVQPGVITQIDKTHFTLIEKMLKCLKYSLYKPSRKEITCEHYILEEQLSLYSPNICFGKFEKEIRKFEQKLKLGNINI